MILISWLSLSGMFVLLIMQEYTELNRCIKQVALKACPEAFDVEARKIAKINLQQSGKTQTASVKITITHRKPFILNC
jgi:hypothetical protein